MHSNVLSVSLPIYQAPDDKWRWCESEVTTLDSDDQYEFNYLFKDPNLPKDKKLLGSKLKKKKKLTASLNGVLFI